MILPTELRRLCYLIIWKLSTYFKNHAADLGPVLVNHLFNSMNFESWSYLKSNLPFWLKEDHCSIRSWKTQLTVFDLLNFFILAEKVFWGSSWGKSIFLHSCVVKLLFISPVAKFEAQIICLGNIWPLFEKKNSALKLPYCGLIYHLVPNIFLSQRC